MPARYNGPYFYHLLGNNDHNRSLEVLTDGYGAGAVLTRTRLKNDLLNQTAQRFSALNTDLLVDAELYNPHDIPPEAGIGLTDLNQTNELADPEVSRSFLEYAMELQSSLGVSRYLIPCPTLTGLLPSWLSVLATLASLARQWLDNRNDQRSLLVTLPVSANMLSNEEERYQLLDTIIGLDSYNVSGFYILSQLQSPPTDTSTITGMLDLIFRLKQQRFDVLLAYVDHWAMLAFPFGLDVFASSASENRRMFKPEDHRGRENGRQPRKKNTYYWSTKLLSKVSIPDDAELWRENGMWELLDEKSPYAPLFDGAPPKTHYDDGWKESASTKQYLWSMWKLADSFQGCDRESRITMVRDWLYQANTLGNMARRGRTAVRDRSGHLAIWNEAFETYLASIEAELRSEFR